MKCRNTLRGLRASKNVTSERTAATSAPPCRVMAPVRTARRRPFAAPSASCCRAEAACAARTARWAAATAVNAASTAWAAAAEVSAALGFRSTRSR